jgi:hypothetical protein
LISPGIGKSGKNEHHSRNHCDYFLHGFSPFFLIESACILLK